MPASATVSPTSATGSASTSSASSASTRGRRRHREARRRRVPRLGDHDRRGLQLQRRRRARVRRARPAGDRLPRGLRRPTRHAPRTRFDDAARSGAAGAGRIVVRLGISPHAPYTVTPELYGCGLSSACRWRRTSRRATSELRLLLGEGGPWESFAELLVTPPGTAGTRLLAEQRGCSGHASSPRTASMVDDEEIALLARARRRGRALPALERRARLRHRAGPRAARRRHDASAWARTARRRRRRSTCSRSCGRALPRPGARAAPGRAHGDRGARARDARLGPRHSASTTRSARSSRASAPTLPSSRWRARPSCPGRTRRRPSCSAAPRERVTATLVDGEVRYERGAFDWHELRQNGEKARDKAARAAAKPTSR